MTEVPEHLLRRAQAAKDKAAAQPEGRPWPGVHPPRPPRPPVSTAEAESAVVEDTARRWLDADARRAARVDEMRKGMEARRRAERRAKVRSVGVMLLVAVGMALAWLAVDSMEMTREECWERGGSYLTESADCLLPPPST